MCCNFQKAASERLVGSIRLRRPDQSLTCCFLKVATHPFETLEELGIDFSEDHEINRQVLIKLGVDESRVRVIPEVVDSTWEEAEALRRYLESERLDSIVITTCRYHSYRAFLNFQESLRDTGVAVYSLPSTHCFYLPDAWWKDRDQTKVLYVELASLAAFFLGSR